MSASPLFERAVPRYTSYPTAPHFHAGVGATQYRDWLAAFDPVEPLSLYLHVPFCQELCWYCGCHTKIVARYEPVTTYARTLVREIALVGRLLPGRGRVVHLHWGGGTPTMLTADDFSWLMEQLHISFDVAPDAEIAVEIDPRRLDETKARALAAAGVTRASLGVQSFDPRVQRAVNRWQPYRVTTAAVERLRGLGITQISFDLMYGFPLQSVESVIGSIELAVALRPQRLALFGYAHVPWMKTHQRLLAEAELPDADERLRQATAASERLQTFGYRWIGLDHFALPEDPLARAAIAGGLRRNFQGYTTDPCNALLGLGCSAIGMLPQGYVQNASDLREWRAAIQGGAPAITRGIQLTDVDRLRRQVIERLMCDLTVDLAATAECHGFEPAVFKPEEDILRQFEAGGLITIDGHRITLTPKGRPLMRIIAASFDRYLAPDAHCHARAV
ncbi:MAG: oxygen-independent coproporphyrinogen III oxidase [Gammaproteobacteria bacterium]